MKDLLSAMKNLGLNPMEQDIMDLCNTVPRNGLIYFPDFCDIVLKRWREENEEVFRQNMFKILCGTEPFPELYRAKKYRFNDHFFTKKDFRHIMVNLPVEVSIVTCNNCKNNLMILTRCPRRISMQCFTMRMLTEMAGSVGRNSRP